MRELNRENEPERGCGLLDPLPNEPWRLIFFWTKMNLSIWAHTVPVVVYTSFFSGSSRNGSKRQTNRNRQKNPVLYKKQPRTDGRIYKDPAATQTKITLNCPLAN